MAVKNQRLRDRLESSDQALIEEPTPSIETSTPNDLLNENVNVESESVTGLINQSKSPSASTFDKSKNEHQNNECTSEISSPRKIEHEVKVFPKRNDGSKWYLKQTNGSKDNQQAPEVKRRISIEPIDSIAPQNTAEMIDVSSKNILNICIGSELPNDANFKVEAIKTGQMKAMDKPKPMVELLSDSDEYDRSDGVDLKISDEFDSQKTQVETSGNPHGPHEQIECSTDNNNLNDETKHQKCFDNVDSSSETQQLPAPKSSAITFFCENLDELKDNDSNNESDRESDSDSVSDSNSSLEEI